MRSTPTTIDRITAILAFDIPVKPKTLVSGLASAGSGSGSLSFSALFCDGAALRRSDARSGLGAAVLWPDAAGMGALFFGAKARSPAERCAAVTSGNRVGGGTLIGG